MNPICAWVASLTAPVCGEHSFPNVDKTGMIENDAKNYPV